MRPRWATCSVYERRGRCGGRSSLASTIGGPSSEMTHSGLSFHSLLPFDHSLFCENSSLLRPNKFPVPIASVPPQMFKNPDEHWVFSVLAAMTARKFPVNFPVSRELLPESGLHGTASTAIKSGVRSLIQFTDQRRNLRSYIYRRFCDAGCR
jgi:hypothetical protein